MLIELLCQITQSTFGCVKQKLWWLMFIKFLIKFINVVILCWFSKRHFDSIYTSSWLVSWRFSCVVVVLLLWIRELDGLWAVSIVEPNPGGWGVGTGPPLVLSTTEQRLPIHHRLQIEPGYNKCLYRGNVNKLYKLVDGTTCWLQFALFVDFKKNKV